MIKINWRRDYHNEFICPKCNKGKLFLCGSNNHSKKCFKCFKCKRKTNESFTLKKGYYTSRLRAYGLGCPSETCNSRQIIQQGKSKGKKRFICRICGATALESNDLIRTNLSRYGKIKAEIKSFYFQDDIWDLRAINKSIGAQDTRYIANFSEIECNWFKTFAKKYILHLAKLNKPCLTIDKYLTTFRSLSRYLVKHNFKTIEEVDRDLILDYLANEKSEGVIITRLGNLRNFFDTGNIQDWFEIDPDIIRNSDYPRQHPSNPDPIPDVVREQIENNLHKLPDSIARMWIICFFAAMRPYELALLKKDCLEQVGDKWKLIWWRKKGKKFHQHSVPITNTIAKVVQEQLEYIEVLWGKDWEYLFCHYHNVSGSNPDHPRIKPVRKVIPRNGNPLQKAIRTLIKAENILDDNGELGKFQPRLIRETRLTELFLKGHDLSVVSAWAGHRRLATTSNFYTQVTCEQIEKEVGRIQSALVNADGKKIYYESMPKSFWDNPVAHELEVAGTHVNTPIYGYCGLDLDEECDKFRACYTCRFFVAKPEKLSQYVNLRDELRDKQERALANGHGVLVEQFARQADQLDKIIASLQEAA